MEDRFTVKKAGTQRKNVLLRYKKGTYMNPDLNVAVLGIGLMGYPMAKQLCQAGYRVHAWNRSAAKAERLVPFGATVHDSAAAAAKHADIVITMLESGPVVDAVLFGDGATTQGAASALRRGALVIDMASIKPREAKTTRRAWRPVGLTHLDAPVSGGTVGAEAATLAIMAGGSAEDFERALPCSRTMGRATHVGPHGSGQLAKLANQMIVGITIGAVAEALLLCEKGGADMAMVRKAITGGFADSRILQVHGQRMVERDFAPRARMSVQLKDLRNALDTAEEIGFDAPVTGCSSSCLPTGSSHGLTDLDHAGLFVELASRNGMQ
jgi:3-hydroxyisobutyrate dehydrogenase-like beta-hydroxyacid dehydrogenase